MSFSNPSPATRFRTGHAPKGGRPSTSWIRKLLREKDAEGSAFRVAIIKHLIELATSYEVRVVGRDSSGEVIKVASGRDSVEAAKLLLAYDVGAPQAPEPTVEIPAGILTEGRPLLDILVDVYRYRLVNGQLTETQLHRLTDSILSIDQAKIALVFKLLGKDPGKDAEDILRLIDKLPAQPTEAVEATATLPPTEPQP